MNNEIILKSIWEFLLHCKSRTKIIQFLMDASEEDILQLYDELRCEADEKTVPEETIEELKELNILVIDVCDAHLIETRLAHPPTSTQREELEKHGVILANKKFTSYEDRIIKKNWKMFAKEYGFTDPRLFMQPYLKVSERLHFVQYLGQGLPNRTLYSIYGRFQRLFTKIKEGHFTPQEDVLIALHIDLYDKSDPFSNLAKLLNRERVSVYKRYAYLTKSEGTEKVKYTTETAEMVIKNLLKVTNMDLESFKTQPISWRTWIEVEKVCGLSAGLMKSLWHRKLYAQLYSAEPIYLYKMKEYLIKRLYKADVESWQHINWNDIANDFDGINPLFLWILVNRIVRKFYPDYKSRNLREMMKYIKKNYIAKLKDRKIDYQLKRLWLTSSGELITRGKTGWCN